MTSSAKIHFEIYDIDSFNEQYELNKKSFDMLVRVINLCDTDDINKIIVLYYNNRPIQCIKFDLIDDKNLNIILSNLINKTFKIGHIIGFDVGYSDGYIDGGYDTKEEMENI